MVDYPSGNPLQFETNLANRVTAAKEAVWFRIGVLQSTMHDREKALSAFERVLAVNPNNVRAMTQAGAVLAKKECYNEAVIYLQRAIATDPSCGEAWAVLAHCYVMTDELQKAYQAYKSALANLPNPRDPNLWYGIGLLYDRYGSLEHALEAFLAVLSLTPDFERADEVCFCIGIIYKEQQRFDDALQYFNRVVVAANPPPPLTRADGWYQIGHVYELKRDVSAAMDMYKQALTENPKHTKTLQNMGWLEHNHNNNSPKAVQYLRQSADLDPSDGQTWYLLGRVYMAMREFHQAYEAYQQAVYRDARNATFWCSIGVLYYQMNQCRDALDAYTRAIRLNPYVSEVWYDLGTLYESYNQKVDAIDAYREAAKLAPDNVQIAAQLRDLENNMAKAHQQPGSSQQMPATQPHPVQQMQPRMTSGAQPRITHLPNRSIPPIGQILPTAAPPHSLPQQQPTAQQPAQRHLRQMLAHHPVLDPSHPQGAMHTMHQRGAPPEMAPIPSIRPPPMTGVAGAPAPTAFAQPPRPSLSASVPLVQPSSQQMAPANPPYASQQLPQHQPPSATPAAPPPMAEQQQARIPLQPSASMPDAKLKPLPHPSLPHDPQLQQHRPIQQQSHVQLPRLASSSSPASTEMQRAQPVHTSRPTGHPSQHLPPREAQPLAHPHASRTTAPTEQQPLPPVQTQQASNLPPMQPVPQMQQQLPQMQQGLSPTSESRQKSADAPALGQADQERPNAAVDSDDSDTNKKGHTPSQLSRDEHIHDRHDISGEAKVPKTSQSDTKMVDRMDIQSDDKNHHGQVYSPSQERPPGVPTVEIMLLHVRILLEMKQAPVPVQHLVVVSRIMNRIRLNLQGRRDRMRTVPVVPESGISNPDGPQIPKPTTGILKVKNQELQSDCRP
ncbi:General transcriptional corepressor trfA [Gracilariopsis chorda]|uniref:General transcriptional corepressor trfA n=1 Tax=Gracilariopsis chorda TaxID=448386 RepID=A0A2V3IJQ7_9FLOR|nr:General transcriptional corepressor trfA [Gracilariopsis chorda]|eukprot:PXF42301.1 General transcriptional corepressor trfA [Gracilariopsis chorda]